MDTATADAAVGGSPIPTRYAPIHICFVGIIHEAPAVTDLRRGSDTEFDTSTSLPPPSPLTSLRVGRHPEALLQQLYESASRHVAAPHHKLPSPIAVAVGKCGDEGYHGFTSLLLLFFVTLVKD